MIIEHSALVEHHRPPQGRLHLRALCVRESMTDVIGVLPADVEQLATQVCVLSVLDTATQ